MVHASVQVYPDVLVLMIVGCYGSIDVLRPRFSWIRIKGESDVQGGRGNGSVEEGEGSWVGATGVGAEGAAAGARALAPGQRWSTSDLPGDFRTS